MVQTKNDIAQTHGVELRVETRREINFLFKKIKN
jgi:hypothetical protein